MTTEPAATTDRWTPHEPTVPPNWVVIDFGQAFEALSVNGKKVPTSDYLAKGALPVVDQGERFISGHVDDPTRAIDPGSGVLVFGDHTRRFKLVRFPFAPGADGIKVLRPRYTSPQYAFFASAALRLPDRGYSRHFGFLVRTRFPIAPPREQHRIVSRIEELFSEIDEGERALERVGQLVERYRQSVLKAAVTGELTREWRAGRDIAPVSASQAAAAVLRTRSDSWLAAAKAGRTTRSYPVPSEPKIGALGVLPTGWAEVSVEAATLAERPVAYGVLQPGADIEGGVPLVRVCDVSDGKIDSSQVKCVAPEVVAAFPRTKLRGGEVLLTIVGTIGRTALVPAELAGANVARAVAVLSPQPAVRAAWLELCLREERMRQLLSGNSREVARKTLNLEQLRECAIPVPPLDEQDAAISRVGSLLSQADAVSAELGRQRRTSTALRQSILKAAFSGQLVPQDPNDEPASALLARLAAQAAEAPAAPRRRGRPA